MAVFDSLEALRSELERINGPLPEATWQALTPSWPPPFTELDLDVLQFALPLQAAKEDRLSQEERQRRTDHRLIEDFRSDNPELATSLRSGTLSFHVERWEYGIRGVRVGVILHETCTQADLKSDWPTISRWQVQARFFNRRRFVGVNAPFWVLLDVSHRKGASYQTIANGLNDWVVARLKNSLLRDTAKLSASDDLHYAQSVLQAFGCTQSEARDWSNQILENLRHSLPAYDQGADPISRDMVISRLKTFRTNPRTLPAVDGGPNLLTIQRWSMTGSEWLQYRDDHEEFWEKVRKLIPIEDGPMKQNC